jgi:hypothetical protein
VLRAESYEEEWRVFVQVLRDPLAATQLGDAVLTAQPFQHHPDLILSGIMLARRTPYVPDTLLGRFLQ